MKYNGINDVNLEPDSPETKAVREQVEWEQEAYGNSAYHVADEAYAQFTAGAPAGTKHALLVIDVQNDFCSGGALAVADAERRIPLINQLIRNFATDGKPKGHIVGFTQDFHPAGHKSFASSHAGKNPFDTIEMPYGTQVLWPDHCVQGTPGADFHPDLVRGHELFVVQKGTNPEVDSYSGARENDQKTLTGLIDKLREHEIDAAHLVGIAGDYCVGSTALDLLQLMREVSVYVYEDGVACIDPDKGWTDMKAQIEDAEGFVIESFKSRHAE